MKNSNNTIGNRTRDLPACRAVPRYSYLSRLLSLTSFLFTFLLFITGLYYLYNKIPRSLIRKSYSPLAYHVISWYNFTLRISVTFDLRIGSEFFFVKKDRETKNIPEQL